MIGMNDRLLTRSKKFFSYYRPYKKLLLADLLCALLVAAAALLLPLCARTVTGTLLQQDNPDVLSQIAMMGAIMIGLVVIHTPRIILSIIAVT